MSRIGDDQDDEWAKWLAYCEQEQKDGREPPSFAEWRSLDHAFKRWRDASGELADLEEVNRRLIERLEELKQERQLHDRAFREARSVESKINSGQKLEENQKELTQMLEKHFKSWG